MSRIFHYPWRALLDDSACRLPSPEGDVISPELGAFVRRNDSEFVELPGPSIQEGAAQNWCQNEILGRLNYSSEFSHQFQSEGTDSSVRRFHFALTDAFIWLSGFLYRYRETSGTVLAERPLSEACGAFKEYLGSRVDFAPESLIVEIARNVPGAIESIVAGPRKVLMREHTEVPIDKIQELDVFSLMDLARRPGRTIAMKAGPKQRMMALTRRETPDTIENRVILDFIKRSAASARQYRDEMCARCPRADECLLRDPVVEKACPSERVKLVAGYLRHCLAWKDNTAFAGVTHLAEPRTRPNYVLQQNVRYVKVWKYYLRLLRLEDVEGDVWRWMRSSWADMVKMLFMLVWEERLKKRSVLQTSRRPFMIRAENRKGRWLVGNPFEDALVFKNNGRYRTLYILDCANVMRLTSDARYKSWNADMFVVCVDAPGHLTVCPVWAFCMDRKCEQTLDAEQLAERTAREVSTCQCGGLAVFPAERNVFRRFDNGRCYGVAAFSTRLNDAMDKLEQFIMEVVA